MPALRAESGVIWIGIFGSFARDEEKQPSDVDLLVEFAPEKATFDHSMRLTLFLEDLFSLKIDLLTVCGIDRYIVTDAQKKDPEETKRKYRESLEQLNRLFPRLFF